MKISDTQYRRFNLAIAVLIAAIVFYGFSQTIDRAVVHPHTPPPTVLYVHVALASAWVLLLVVQSALVWSRNIALHRRLGTAGLVLGALVSAVSFVTAIDLRRLDIAGDADVAYLVIPLTAFLTFTVPFALAAYWRKWPDLHRPLILLAGIAVTAPALARFPGVRPNLLFLTVLIPDLMIVATAAIDAVRRRRFSPVYGWGLAGMMATQIVGLYALVAQPAWWMATARLLLTLPI